MTFEVGDRVRAKPRPRDKFSWFHPTTDEVVGTVTAVRPQRHEGDQWLDIDWDDGLADDKDWPSYNIIKV